MAIILVYKRTLFRYLKKHEGKGKKKNVSVGGAGFTQWERDKFGESV